MKVRAKISRYKFFIFVAWLYVVVCNTCFITSNKADNLIQIVLICLLLMCVYLSGIKLRVDMIGIGFCALIAVSIIPDFFNGTIISGVRMALSYILPIIMYICVINYGEKEKYMSKTIWRIPIWFGLFISLLGILNFFLRFTGYPLESTVTYVEKFGNNMEFFQFGLGVSSSWGELAGKTMYRVQTYFIEPSKMAMFLLIPLYLSWYSFKESKKLFALVEFIILLFAFLLTMSRAGILAFIGSYLLGAIIKRKRTTLKRATCKDLKRLVLSGMVFVIGAVCFVYVLVYFSEFFPDMEFLFVGITDENGKANLIRNETVSTSFILNQFVSNPLGSGFGSILELNKVTNLANAFILWLVIGGIPAVVILIFLMWKLLMHYYIPGINSYDGVQHAFASAFMALTIHSLSYGTWMTSEYLLTIAGMVLLQRINVNKNKLENNTSNKKSEIYSIYNSLKTTI